MFIRSFIFLLLYFSVHINQVAAKPALEFDRLTCEYATNPLGIDISRPRLSWTLLSKLRDQRQSAYEVIVSTNIRDVNRLKGTAWQSGRVKSSQSLHITYAGAKLKPFTTYYWRVRVYDEEGKPSTWSRPQHFETAMLEPTDWKGEWISDGKRQFEKDEDFYKNDPMPLFRKTFRTTKSVRSARLYISGLGYYEAYLNGQKVGDHVLDPGWTSYSKQVLYSIYDVTSQITKGDNAAGIMLGNGWYNPLPLKFWGGLNMRNALTTGRPVVKAMIRISYNDGSTDLIHTDASWKTSAGPIIRNGVFLGEQYDARAERKDWNTTKGDDEGWTTATLATGPSGRLSAQMQPPIRLTKIFKPLSVREVKSGVFVFDMGQNFAGVARIRVKGAAGTQVKIRYGEDRYPDGSLNGMTAVAGQIKTGNGGPGAPAVAWQEDSYILKGEGVEQWSPRFTFHGFRFVEVTGWPGTPTINDIDGLRLNADLQESGQFASSNQMFNKLDTNIKYTFLSNAFSVQSDCPGREKLGYGGDLFCTTESFMYHYDVAAFYRKIVRDFTDDQTPQGGITETVPFVGIADAGPGDRSGPLGFQIGYPYLVKKIYDFYGDKRLIEENYPALKKHVNFLRSKTSDHLFNTDLGDHESLDDRSIPLTASIFYYLHVRMMAEFANALENQTDQKQYASLANEIRSAIQQKFNAGADGKFEKGTQTTQAFAIWSEMARTGKDQQLIEVLTQEIEKKNWHVSTGIFGTKMLFDVLRKADLNETAYRIANQRDYPGWGYMIANGATTLWETWAASDGGFSKNHPMFGSVGEWFYRSLLGINSAAPGFSKMDIRPQPAGDLTYAGGSYQTPYGKVSSSWKIDQRGFSLEVQIPVNTTADIYVPKRFGTKITNSAGLTLQRDDQGCYVYQVGSGNYSFQVSR